MSTSAQVILDSVNADTGDRLTTLVCNFPRSILPELVSHRLLFVDPTDEDISNLIAAYDADMPHILSKNAASSRAVPIKRMIGRVRDMPFIPVFRTAQKGMASGVPAPDHIQEAARRAVEDQMHASLHLAEYLESLGLEKGQVNRYIEPYSYIEVLITATEWNNFLLLRDHQAAIVEIQELARCIREARDRSKPRVLHPGEWHLPFIDQDTSHWQNKRSAAHCARISYRSLVTGQPSTPEEDDNLFNKLVSDERIKHLSPLEHPAVALDSKQRCGNLVGWRSLRKDMFPGVEAGGDIAT